MMRKLWTISDPFMHWNFPHIQLQTIPLSVVVATLSSICQQTSIFNKSGLLQTDFTTSVRAWWSLSAYHASSWKLYTKHLSFSASFYKPDTTQSRMVGGGNHAHGILHALNRPQHLLWNPKKETLRLLEAAITCECCKTLYASCQI